MILSRDSHIARYYATSSWIFTTNKVLMVRDIWLKDSDIGDIAYSCKGKYSNRNILKITGKPLRTVQHRAKRFRVNVFNDIKPLHIKYPWPKGKLSIANLMDLKCNGWYVTKDNSPVTWGGEPKFAITCLRENQSKSHGAGPTLWEPLYTEEPIVIRHQATKLNKKWFNLLGINYIKVWSSNSPDLNLIENLWSIVNQDRDTLPVLNLKAVVRYIWDNLEINTLQNLALSLNVSLN